MTRTQSREDVGRLFINNTREIVKQPTRYIIYRKFRVYGTMPEGCEVITMRETKI